MFKPLLFLLILSFMSLSCFAGLVYQEVTESGRIQVEPITDEHGVIWGMAFVAPDEILFTTRKGAVKKVNINNGRVMKISNAPSVMSEGQGGLLDVAVPPNFQKSKWIYFTYVKKVNGRGVTTLARAVLEGNALIQWQNILVTLSATDTYRHFGSRIAFDGEGHVFFTIGDRGVRSSAQDLSNHNGSVIRLNLDGSVPKDNPFADRANGLPEIWSYGHRNPQGIAFDFENARLWLIEHGPRGGDEINLVVQGRNYGWPDISYGKEYWGPVNVSEATRKPGMEQPHKVYVPSIAPGSLLLYRGNGFPRWKGSLLAGALKLRHINRVSMNADGEIISEERILNDFGERIRALVEGPDGFVYFSTDSGKIYRIRPVIQS